MSTALTLTTLVDEAWAEMRRARDTGASYHTALGLARRAVRQAESAGLPLAPAQYALANIYKLKSDYKTACDVLEFALKEQTSDTDRILLTNLLIACLSADGKSERACSEARRLSPLVFAVGDDTHTGQFYRNYADALNRLGEVDQAIEQYTGAEIHYEKVKDYRRRAEVSNNLASLLVKVNRVSDAHYYLDTARTYFHSTNNRSALGQVYETLACAYEAEQKYETALAAINQSLDLLIGGDEAALIRASHITRGRLLELLPVCVGAEVGS